LIYSGQRQIADYRLWSEIMVKTEDNSIIITRYHDKLFFPERQVIVGLFDNEVINQYYSHLMASRPVYYFNFRFQPEALDYLNSRQLFKYGYTLQELWQYDKFALYRLVSVDQPVIKQ
jgi:hypothetical protein